jgi:N-acetylglutamate synthase-like GNAT family acetyltransferase
MTEVAPRSATSLAAPVTIRSYRPGDHRACRELWAELTRARRTMYADRTVDADPGAGFEEYLTRLGIVGIWVAEHVEEGVVGLVGLVLDGRRSGAVEPLVVAERMRGHHIGQTLLEHVSDEARRRDMTQLSVSPESRNVEAIHSLRGAGFNVLASVTLTMDLAPRGHSWQQGLDLHGLDFLY